MKKRIMAVVLAAAMTLGLAGCGKKDPAYLSGIKAEDYVELCDYSSIPVEEAQPSVSDDYVNMYIQYTLSSSAVTEEVTDRDDVESGDIVNIDYTGKIDGKEFDGGSAKGYDLTIGSGSFIDGFEDGLIGKKVGETVDLNLKFPDDYGNTDVAGKDVVFTVKINKISQKVTPELTDDWVSQQNITGVSTVDAYRDYVKKQLMTQAQQTYDSDVQQKIAQYLVDNSTFKKDPPTEMVDRFDDQITSNYAQQYGMTAESFREAVTGTGSTESSTESATESATEAVTEAATEAVTEAAAEAATEETTEAATESSTESASEDSSGSSILDSIHEAAVNTAKEYIVIQAVADKEGMKITGREYKNQAAVDAASMGYSSIDEFEKNEDKKAYKEYMLAQKVLEFLMTKANVTEPSDESSTESTTESAEESSTGSTEADTAE